MMVFLGTIFAILAFDTNKAIYNRIVAQNAVDSAADSAALWQARGCNLLQQLNNLHYDTDLALCIAEGVSSAACIVSAGMLVAELAADATLFGAAIGEAIHVARLILCEAGCIPLPWIDLAQQLFYKAIMPIEQGVVDVTPFLAFGYANACAKGSGADPLLQAVADAGDSFLSEVGINIPSGGSIGSAISSGLGSIPIYAAPLDPDSLKLYVSKRNNDGSPPLYFPSGVGQAGDVGGTAGCSDAIPITYGTSKSGAQSATWDGTWGWDDQYYFGHPGFMTWIAGKTKHDELLGLGSLSWLNGGQKTADQVSKVIYTGPNTGAGSLQIPGYIALASSQVEGTPVVAHGEVNAQPKLIKVYLPGSSPKSLEQYWIYH